MSLGSSSPQTGQASAECSLKCASSSGEVQNRAGVSSSAPPKQPLEHSKAVLFAAPANGCAWSTCVSRLARVGKSRFGEHWPHCQTSSRISIIY